MKTNKQNKPFYKKVWFWIVVVILLLFVGAGSSESDSKNNSHKSSRSSSAFSSKKTDTSSKEAKEKAKLKNVNKALAKRLAENQQFAENGSDSFAYAQYLYKVTAQDKNEISVYVRGDFLSLSKAQKDTVAHSAQSMAQSVLYEEGFVDEEEVRKRPTTTFYLNENTSIGITKVFDQSEFKWNDSAYSNYYK